MKKRLWLLSASLPLLLAESAHGAGPAFYAGSGDFGQDLQIIIGLHNDFRARLNINFINSETATTMDRDELDFNRDSRHQFKSGLFDTLLDWRPPESNFFLTGGAIAARNLPAGLAQSNMVQNYGDQGNLLRSGAMAAANGIAGTVDNHTITPYVGMGWKSRPAQKMGWRVLSDFGMLYRGRTTISLTNTSCLFANMGAAGLCHNFESGNAGGITSDARGNFSRYVPVLRAGISYVF